MSSTMDLEEAQLRDLFGRVGKMQSVAHSIRDDHPRESAELLQVSRDELSQAPPVRVSIAARLLLVSDKTIRSWVSEGVLTPRHKQPRLVLDTERLHEVLQLVMELRAKKQDQALLASLWERLADEALLDRDDLAESLEQLQEGSTAPALTFEEERTASR